MRKFGIGILISGVLAGLGFHYWEIRWQLQVANFRNEIWISENRIMRDEMNELRSKKTYQEGCIDTALRMKIDNGFYDGVSHVLSVLPENDYIKGYHSCSQDGWSMVYFQNLVAEKKLERAKEEAFSQGRKDGYESAIADTKQQESHPDFSNPRDRLKKELQTKSPFKTVDNEDGQN